MEKKEAMKILKDFHDKSALFSVRTALDTVLPELKESEEEMMEKIRKRIISYLNNRQITSIAESSATKRWLTWLEKQGEQKPVMEGTFVNVDEVRDDFMQEVYRVLDADSTNDRANQIIDAFDNLPTVTIEKQGEQNPIDKVEPKFHEGEWITNGDYTWKIVEVKPLDYILQSQDGNIVDDTISHVDEQFHSFTIEDAKDGDVVVDKSDGTIGIFQSIGHHPDGGSYNDPSYCFLHCRYDDGYFYADFENGNTMDSDDAIPATKEQCDTLFAKMKDAGYIFDFKKKELKEIEQKPTWSEKDDYYRDNLITWLNCRAVRVDIRKDFIDWLKSLKQRINKE